MAAAMMLCVWWGAATSAAVSRFSEIIRRNSTTSAPVEVERTSRIIVEGNLYRFCDRSYSRESWETWQVTTPFIPCKSFEVLESDQSKWLPLELPPCDDPVVRDALLPEINFEYLVAGPYILRWAREYGGALRFDVTRPEQGWTEVDVPDLMNDAEMLLIELRQRGHEGYLIFACDRGRYRCLDIDVLTKRLSKRYKLSSCRRNVILPNVCNLCPCCHCCLVILGA